MAARVSDAEVKGIVKVDATISTTPFINTATVLTDYVAAQDASSILSAAHLKEIELYLAAHFYSHRDQLYQFKGMGRAQANFQGKTNMGLASTQYGQTALVMDVTGTLARLDQQMTSETAAKRPEMAWLGKEVEDQDNP